MHALERLPKDNFIARRARTHVVQLCKKRSLRHTCVPRHARFLHSPAALPESSSSDCANGDAVDLADLGRATMAFICGIVLTLSPGPGQLSSAAEAYSVAAYESAVAVRREGGDGGPNMSLFTDDAQLAMARLREYARYVSSLSSAEERCGPDCPRNREVLERAWQVVASEHFSASGTFKQAAWADTLLEELRSRNGLLPSQSSLQSAISHMLASLADPYTEYLPPSAFRRAIRRPLPSEQSYLRAQYVGLGLELGPVTPEGGRVVLAPLAGSPAEAAGIARGDRLISIDGTPVDKLTTEQLKGLLRGPAGSIATLEWVPAPTATATGAAPVAGASAAVAVQSSSLSQASVVAGAAPSGGIVPSPAAAGGRRIVMDVERRDLPQPAIKVSHIPVGAPGFYATYVRVLYFGSETTEGLEGALRLEESAPGNVGYILDLRNNPGGVFEEAIASASLFLAPGEVVASTVRGPGEVVDAVWQVGNLPEELFPSLPGRLATKPVVLLGNRSTASASEVFAGALRDNRRAILLGERTFGKGLVQYYFPLREGKDGGVRVTVAKYITPSGYDISARGAGLAPDRACSDFPRGGLPTSLQQSDLCIRQAASLLGVRA